MFNYAQLDEHGSVVGVSALGGEVIADNMVRIVAYDESLLGKLYNRETGEFE